MRIFIIQSLYVKTSYKNPPFASFFLGTSLSLSFLLSGTSASEKDMIHCWAFRPPYCAPQVLDDGARARGIIKLLVLLWRRQHFSPFQEPPSELFPVSV